MADDADDNPPNPNRFPSSSSRPNPFNRFPFAPHPAESESDSDEPQDLPQNDVSEDSEDSDDDDQNHNQITNLGDGLNQNCEQESSEESRGKRRKLDQFEFAPRAPPPPAVAAPAHPKPFARNPLVDWTEDETFILLEAWGDRYVKNGRKSLRSEEWNEVARRVCQGSRIKRTESQCRNRVDTLKKKYKKEKAKISENGNFISNWIYFKKMDALMSVPFMPPKPVVNQQQFLQQQVPRMLPSGDGGEYGFTNLRVYGRGSENEELRNGAGDSGSEEDDEENESEGLPPRRENVSRGSDSSYRMLAYSIRKFGEVYEKIEHNNRMQMAELERMRREFQRDLEVRQRQILERAQAEIAKLREEEGELDDEEDEEEDDDDDDNDDGDDDDNGGGTAENLSGFLAGSVYLTVFA